jgi:hypothetical protein
MVRLFVIWLAMAACKHDRIKPGAVARPFGMVENVLPGASCDEVRARVPQLKPAPPIPSDVGITLVANEPSAAYAVQCVGGKVARVSIEVLQHPPSDVTSAWGAGEVWGDHAIHYFDRAAHLRADVRPDYADTYWVDVVEYTPLAKLLDKDPTRVGGMIVLGRTGKELAAAVKAHGAHILVNERAQDPFATFVYDLPRTEWMDGASLSHVTVSSEDTPAIVTWTFEPVSTLYGEAVSPGVLAVYEQTWGKPVSEASDQIVYGQDPPIVVEKKHLSITVRSGSH